jgi:hypothetical protein
LDFVMNPGTGYTSIFYQTANGFLDVPAESLFGGSEDPVATASLDETPPGPVWVARQGIAVADANGAGALSAGMLGGDKPARVRSDKQSDDQTYAGNLPTASLTLEARYNEPYNVATALSPLSVGDGNGGAMPQAGSGETAGASIQAVTSGSLTINLVLDAQASRAPAAIKAAWNTAASIMSSLITDNITVNLGVHYRGTGGGASAGPTSGLFESYQSVYTYLTTHASPGDTTFSSLPNTATIGGQSQVAVWDAQLKLMGITVTDATDGDATFATDIPSSLMVGVALHEFGHAMGRIGYGPQADIFDFYRYTGLGTRLFSAGNTAPAAYFSLNGGLTRWFDYGQTSDPSDYLNSPNSLLSPNDPYNEFYDSNTLQSLTPADIEQIDALGFHLKHNAPAVNSYDFTGNGNGDVLLQNGTGQIVYANMLGGAFQNWANLANTPGWTVKGQGKIAGTASSNVVIENTSNQILYGSMLNGSVSSWVTVATTPGYDVVGVGDINGDQYADIVVQIATTGSIVYANMNGGNFTNWMSVGSTSGWTVDGVADINGDGYADIVIQNQTSGAIDYANMNGGVFNGWVSVATPLGYNVVGAGDINRDGYADIVVQNPATGQIIYANMNGGNFSGWVGAGSTPGLNVIAVEDVINNGFADIVVDDPVTGQISYADMTTGTRQSWVSVASAPGYGGVASRAPAGGAAASVVQTAPVGDATLTAASTGPNLFVFDDIGFGNDTIAGFDPTRDRVQLPQTRVADLATLNSETSSVAAGTLITLNPSQSILIDGIAPGRLGSGNFHFV